MGHQLSPGGGRDAASLPPPCPQPGGEQPALCSSEYSQPARKRQGPGGLIRSPLQVNGFAEARLKSFEAGTLQHCKDPGGFRGEMPPLPAAGWVGGKDRGPRSYPQWEAASQPSRKHWGTFSRQMGRNPRDTHFPGAGLEVPGSVSYFKKGFFVVF